MRTYMPLILILFIFSGSLASCKSKKEQESTAQEPEKLQHVQFRRKLEIINPGLYDPAGVIQLIELSGAKFIPELINDWGMDSIYLSDSVLSAINLGIYTVDMVYLLAYERNEKFDKHLEKAQALADNLGAGHLYDHVLYKRYRAAGAHPDTLIKYLSKAAEKMEHDYGEKGLLRLSTLYTTGEFIEKLHLSTLMLSRADKAEADHYWTLMLLLFHQEKALDELIILLDQIRDKEEGERFMAMMNDLKHIFMEMNHSEELAGINTQNITEKQVFKDLVEQLSIIRNLIVLPE